ncbi:MAG: pyruvate kinase [Rhodomicrobium sp.]|nr:pyruvate kinase [Rhodomicrobium sp.]
MKRERRVKIIATLGPSTCDPAVMERLVLAGADVFRINMSHSSHEEMRTYVAALRELEGKYGPIAILADLQGPKLRISSLAEGQIRLERGQRVVFDANHTPGNADRIGLLHPEIYAAAEPGHTLLIDDGKLNLKILEAGPGRLVAEVVAGGILSSRKGVNLPDAILPLASMTAKDREDCVAALDAGVDWVAISFVQRPQDILDVKAIVKDRAAIMAKMERRAAILAMNEILEECDGVMVARGDLGVELPLEQVPGLQKQLLRAARHRGKPVVVATQMLESMTASPVPTRAEVSDVATAVFEGADAVMLSAESATGAYPTEAVATMDRVAREVEKDTNYEDILHFRDTCADHTTAGAMSAAAASISETLNLKAIVCYTATGTTGLRVAQQRPRQPILVLTPVKETSRRLNLVWGLNCVETADPANTTEMVRIAETVARSEHYAADGDRVIVCAGVPFKRPGTTNMLRVFTLGKTDTAKRGS